MCIIISALALLQHIDTNISDNSFPVIPSEEKKHFVRRMKELISLCKPIVNMGPDRCLLSRRVPVRQVYLKVHV